MNRLPILPRNAYPPAKRNFQEVDTHLHECGHRDRCFLSPADASGSDCRECRSAKFNREHAPRSG